MQTFTIMGLCVYCTTARGVCQSSGAKQTPAWPLVMFTPLKPVPTVAHLTGDPSESGPLCWRHGREAAESLLQQRRSCYFTINVKPLLFVIGNTQRPRCCRCCCHILICSPLWKTPASINFAFMVCTHNKWAWGIVVYQPPVLLSNLLGCKIYIYKGECVWTPAIFRVRPLIYVLSKTI